MANVSKQDTGLPYDLWIDSIGKDRKAKSNVPKLKVDINGELIPVSISENPKVLINKEFPEFFAVRRYITLHLDVFLKHWNKGLTDRQALNLLEKI